MLVRSRESINCLRKSNEVASLCLKSEQTKVATTFHCHTNTGGLKFNLALLMLIVFVQKKKFKIAFSLGYLATDNSR